jgi:hypothetical protein
VTCPPILAGAQKEVRDEATERSDGRPQARLQVGGTDGNVFSIIGRVKQALKKADQEDRAREFVEKAFRAKSYNEILALCTEYVDVR